MSHWENSGKSDEWYTPEYIFHAMGYVFDTDVAAASVHEFDNVPTLERIYEDSLNQEWKGFIWMNPPFGGRNGIVPWLDKFFTHGNGVALTPDRTSADWWQDAAEKCDALLHIRGKVKFIRPDGTTGNSPSNGTTLFAIGSTGVAALKRAAEYNLGSVFYNKKQPAGEKEEGNEK